MSRPDPQALPPVVQPEYGATVLERLLLAIINAHTTPETEGSQRGRLRAAATALIGPAQGGYRPRAFEDAYFADILEAEALTRMCAELAEWDVLTRL